MQLHRGLANPNSFTSLKPKLHILSHDAIIFQMATPKSIEIDVLTPVFGLGSKMMMTSKALRIFSPCHQHRSIVMSLMPLPNWLVIIWVGVKQRG